MGLTSEQVHRLGGVAFTLVALLLLARRTQAIDAAWIDWLLPALLVAYGVESFADLWVHGSAVPEGYAAESSQHLVQGTIVLAAGIVEGLLLYGALRHPAWSAVLPLALVAIGVVFALHAQHGAGADAMVMTTQHRAFAIALFVAAAAKALAALPSPPLKAFETVWLAPLLVFGLLLLTYTEASTSHAAH
jgi:predicted RND superfamily exporter protein